MKWSLQLLYKYIYKLQSIAAVDWCFITMHAYEIYDWGSKIWIQFLGWDASASSVYSCSPAWCTIWLPLRKHFAKQDICIEKFSLNWDNRDTCDSNIKLLGARRFGENNRSKRMSLSMQRTRFLQSKRSFALIVLPSWLCDALNNKVCQHVYNFTNNI